MTKIKLACCGVAFMVGVGLVQHGYLAPGFVTSMFAIIATLFVVGNLNDL